MEHVALLIERDAEGNLVPLMDTLRIGDDPAELRRQAATEPGQVVAVWDCLADYPLTRKLATELTEDIYPHRVYMRAQWNEFLLLDTAYTYLIRGNGEDKT